MEFRKHTIQQCIICVTCCCCVSKQPTSAWELILWKSRGASLIICHCHSNSLWKYNLKRSHASADGFLIITFVKIGFSLSFKLSFHPKRGISIEVLQMEASYYCKFCNRIYIPSQESEYCQICNRLMTLLPGYVEKIVFYFPYTEIQQTIFAKSKSINFFHWFTDGLHIKWERNMRSAHHKKTTCEKL